MEGDEMDFFSRGPYDFTFNDENHPTASSEEQKEVEHKVRNILLAYRSQNASKKKHVNYLVKGLEKMSSGYQSLDASRPWLCYWIIHSLDLLGEVPDAKTDHMVDFLSRCQSPSGGFGGGPGQLPHLAPTYAAVNALMICGPKAYDMINREKLYHFLLSVKSPSGGFVMHRNGESDVRGAYCALSVAALLNLLTPELTEGVGEYIASCQTYEGGMGGEPGNEAHGGYSFCAYAALVILKKTHLVDNQRLLNWAVHRQMGMEGGFQGRTNKLVDGCYSWWMGGLFPLLHLSLHLHSEEQSSDGDYLYLQKNLQHYILGCCQDNAGGLRDKPDKSRDYYHTCYCLSGLSSAQHNENGHPPNVVGQPSNLLFPTHPVHNIRPERVSEALEYFSSKPRPE